VQAFGSDRVRAGDGEERVLFSRLPKGWTPRTPKSLTQSEFPGTAVLWDELYFEVVDVEPLPQGGVRYLLAPWAEHHAMRITDRYDAESEEARIAAYRSELAREKRRKSANLFGIFTGHLPQVVQDHLGRELGINPARLTMLSAAVLFITCGPFVFFNFAKLVGGEQLPVPFFLFVLMAWWTVESVLRFNVAFVMSRSVGSLEGYFVYAAYHFLAPGREQRVSPFASGAGEGVSAPLRLEAPPDVAIQDELLMREPFVTLLSPAEQQLVATRTGYDYTRKSTSTAIFILIMAILGIITSVASLRGGFHLSAFLSLIVAAALAGEQLLRLASFRNGPAGSMLAVLVRPLTKKLRS
jgi:hypothetical protein